MNVKATDLRKNLFQTLDQAIHGEPVQVTYKGVSISLISAEGGSKLARSISRDALLVDPDSIVGSDSELMEELSAKWSGDDSVL